MGTLPALHVSADLSRVPSLREPVPIFPLQNHGPPVQRRGVAPRLENVYKRTVQSLLLNFDQETSRGSGPLSSGPPIDPDRVRRVRIWVLLS